jgi:putative ABC transport system permease protein
MDTLLNNVRYAVRALRRQPGFTAIALLTLALGIGANTAVFSVVSGVLLRQLPYPAPEQLQYITSQFPGLGFNQFWVSLPEFLEFRDHNQAFASVGAYNIGAANLGTATPSRPVRALLTADFMPTLRVPPAAGRWFSEADTRPGAEEVAILSWELWKRAFGGDSGALNLVIDVNNIPNRIVGIMPPGYDIHDQKVELWQPLTIDPASLPNTRGGHFLYLVGRMKPGITADQARGDIERLLTQWATIAPNTHAPNPQGHRLRMDPLKADMVAGVRVALYVLQGAVAFVLLIACANLANLLLARAESRQREFAVRTALGASPRQLLWQFITEGIVLSLGGAIAGVGLAWAGISTLLAANPNGIPRAAEIRLDWRVLSFTLGLAVVTGIVFGLAPLLHLGTRLGTALRDGARTTAGAFRLRLRGALVIAEVALAVMLVVGAGLLLRSFINLMNVDAGFNRSQLATFGVVLPGSRYNAEQRVAFYARLADRLRQVPGVHSVAAMSGLPPLRNVNANDTDFEAIPDTPNSQGPAQNVDFYQYVSAGYTGTMGIPVLQGRTFQASDLTGPPVVLVNEALAHRFFADRNPIGQRVKPGFGDRLPWFTIVGVLKDVKQGGIGERAGTELYMLTDQQPAVTRSAPGLMNYMLRLGVPLDTVAPQFRQALREIDPTLPMIRMRTMEDVIDDSVSQPRFLTLLLGIFAGLAMLLAAIGTYGVLSYLVTERRQEIGIRLALGADRSSVLHLVLGRGLALAACGLAIGLAGAAAMTRLVRTLLFNVTPTDPTTLAVVAITTTIVASIACLVPAWRATRVDPIAVLRE